MAEMLDSLFEGGRQIMEFGDEDEAAIAVLLEDGAAKRFLLWEGPDAWFDMVLSLLEGPELPCLPRRNDEILDGDMASMLLECPLSEVEPFDIWKWRNLSALRCVDSLTRLAETLHAIHARGFALHGIRRSELLLDPSTGHLVLAAIPRLRRLDGDRETVWRDIRIFAELAYENFLEHEYPGGHQLVALLQDRSAMAERGITIAGLSQLMAGCVTPYGDLAYKDIDDLLVGLGRLRVELNRPLDYRVGSRSTLGNHIFRQNNQDSCGHVIIDTICNSQKIRLGFFCVADGIGGIRDGERASALAVQTACSTFLRAWNHYGGESLQGAPVAFARAIAQVTSQRLTLEGDFSPESNRGGTTFTGALLIGDRLGICHVGDSRAHLIREGQVIELSSDHTLAAILARLGQAPAADAEDASHRTISRFISTGTELTWSRIDSFCPSVGEKLDVDAGELMERGITLQRGDLVVLTSDGAHGEFSHADLMGFATRFAGDPQAICDAIVDQSLQRIGRDNATALVILVE